MDALRIANWQRTKDGQKNRNRPKPISPLAKPEGRTYGGKKTTRSRAETSAYLDRIGPRPKQLAPAG